MISVNTAKTTMAAIINTCARVRVCVCANQVVDFNGKSTPVNVRNFVFLGASTSILVCQSNEMKNIWSKTLYVYVCMHMCVSVHAYSAVIYYYPCHVPHRQTTVSSLICGLSITIFVCFHLHSNILVLF